MGVMEAIGFFWVILATGLFTAVVLIALVWSIAIGAVTIRRRYKLGRDMERVIGEPAEQEEIA